MLKKTINNYTLLYNLPTCSAQEKYWTINRNFTKTYFEIEKKYVQEELLDNKEFILDTTFGGSKEN